MKFGQKAILLFITVFFAGACIISALYLAKSNELNNQSVISNSAIELNIIRDSVQKRLNSVSQYYHQFTSENIGMYIKPYGEYYNSQGVYLQIGNGFDVLYSSLGVPVTMDNNATHIFFEYAENRYFACRDDLPLDDGQSFEIILVRDVQSLVKYGHSMLWFSIYVNIISVLIIGCLMYFLIRHLTKPLHDLSGTAQQLADGHYSERAHVNTNDEIGQFADTFNVMADSVERHIHEMDELVKDRQRFTDHLAHEIRTPITAMIGYSQVLLHAKATEEDKQRAAEYIGQQSLRLKMLSEKLLNLSRLQYDTIELTKVNIRDVVGAAIGTLNAQLVAKNIHVKEVVPDIEISGDSVLLETLFQNLIENAIHASSPGQEIVISGKANGGHLLVSVQDHGIGIAAENLERITEPFMRVDAAKSRLHGGVGIGLALCKKISEIHHATLRITSAPGCGTTVELDFTI